MYQDTRILDEPTFSGPAGRAWQLRLPPVGQRGRPDADGTVAGFIVHVPGAHIAWDHWMVSVIHLRPIAGAKAAVLTTPGATHEFLILALDPAQPLPPLDADADFAPHWLQPIDVVEQFVAADDAVAAQIGELAVRAIVEGQASPDQDYRVWWRRAIATLAARARDGADGLPRA